MPTGRPSPATSLAAALGLLLVAGCPPVVDDPDGGLAPPRDEPPAAPEEDDPTFAVTLPAWSLVGDALTPAQDTLAVSVQAPSGTLVVDVWVGGGPGRRLTREDDLFVGELDVSAFGPGQVEVLLAADGSETAFALRTVQRSHALYVMVGTDWDDADTSDTALALQDELHDEHPELKLTHYVGPYTFTDPALTADRVSLLVDWLQRQRDTFADEIGVHIHPWCNFVETTDVECRTQPSLVYATGDPSGYTIESAAYTEEEYTTLLLAADVLFEAHGFAKPISFRAGAWSADASTLQALENAGYLTDSDAYNWARMEEWIGLGNGAFYEWVSEHWAAIGDESQPYFPSVAEPMLEGEPAFDLLEIPLNGVMADYVTEDEMIEILGLNWSGAPLSAPLTFAIGFHPSNFDVEYKRRIHEALLHTDQHLASAGLGPVVHATAAELLLVYPTP